MVILIVIRRCMLDTFTTHVTRRVILWYLGPAMWTIRSFIFHDLSHPLELNRCAFNWFTVIPNLSASIRFCLLMRRLRAARLRSFTYTLMLKRTTVVKAGAMINVIHSGISNLPHIPPVTIPITPPINIDSISLIPHNKFTTILTYEWPVTT